VTGNSLPKQVLLDRVAMVSCGGIHNCALTEDGRVFTWGCGSDGRLGHPEYEGHTYLYKESKPKEVLALRGAVCIASSYYHNVAIGLS
jgi:alpha-tubulin suppressor-like RCC1 family protein